MNPYDTPGLRYVGHVSHPHVSNGKPLPVFEPVTPEGRPDINTLEGWTALTNKYNSIAFRDIFGRDTICIAELRAWEDSHFSKDFEWDPSAEQPNPQ